MKIRYLLILFLMGFVADSVLAQNYKIGDVITNDDGSRGVVFYVKPDGSGGWMVALTDASTSCRWGTSGDIPTLSNWYPPSSSNEDQMMLYQIDGYGNTQK